MAEYHVGCGLAGIYAGTLKKNGQEWRDRSEVTREALSAVAMYLHLHDKEFRFKAINNNWYAMRIVGIEDEESEGDIQDCQ